MRDYLEQMLGTTGALIAQFAITLIGVLILILIVFWLIRRFSSGRFGAGPARMRQPRLSVLDALPLDPRRRLVLIRRDNVEHLLLIGGPSDIVVEGAIQRPPPGQRRTESTAARTGAAAQRGSVDTPRSASSVEASRSEPYLAEPEQAPEFEPVRPASDPRAEAPIAEDEPVVATQVASDAPPVAVPPESDWRKRTAEPAPAAAKPARAMPVFLSRGRGRQPAAEEVDPPSLPAREPVRSRPIEPQRVPSNDPTPQEAAPRVSRTPMPVTPIRMDLPPAPPIPSASLGEEPYGAPEPGPGQPFRFEPIFDVEPATEEEAFPDAAHSHRDAVPEIAPPERDDLPVAIDEAFDENAPVIDRDEQTTTAKRPSQVGDLEKEMACLLGEISGNRR